MSTIKEEFKKSFAKEHGSESLEDGGDSIYWVAVWAAKWMADYLANKAKSDYDEIYDSISSKTIYEIAKELS